MEITPPHIPTTISRPLAGLVRRLNLIAVCIGIILSGWTVWKIWSVWNDLPLPPDRVTAKQLRVSESQRIQITQDLATLRSTSATTAVPNITFTVNP